MFATHSRLFIGATALATTLTALVPADVAQAAPPVAFETITLGPLATYTWAQPVAVNNLNIAAGTSMKMRGMFQFHQATRWDQTGAASNLGALIDGEQSWAVAINDKGMIAGTSGGGMFSGTGRAVRWDLAGRISALDPLPDGMEDSSASGINAHGVVVGAAQSPLGSRAVRWDRDGHATDLGTAPGDDYSYATKINNAGSVVGISIGIQDGVYTWHILRWDAQGRPTVLFAAPAHSVGEGRILDINDRGVVVAVQSLDSGSRSLRWDRDGRMTVLAPLAGDMETAVAAINDEGTAVGWSANPGIGTTHAVRWDEDGKANALPPVDALAWAAAIDVNARGRVAGLSGGHTVLWDRRGRITDLTALTGQAANVVGINDKETVIGKNPAIMWRRTSRDG